MFLKTSNTSEIFYLIRNTLFAVYKTSLLSQLKKRLWSQVSNLFLDLNKKDKHSLK